MSKREKLENVKLLSKNLDVDFSGWIPGSCLYSKDDDGYNYGYEPSYSIDNVLCHLNITKDDKIIDLGCGKGYSLYLLSKYPFSKIDGIEKIHFLYSIAVNNIEKIFKEDYRFSVYEGDVKEFKFYHNYNYFYLFNPFGKGTIEKVIRKIIETSGNKKVIVIYQCGEFKQVFLDYGFTVVFEKIITVFCATTILTDRVM